MVVQKVADGESDDGGVKVDDGDDGNDGNGGNDGDDGDDGV